MEKKNKTYMTIVWIICLFISIDIGNHVLNFFTNIGLNVWIARIMGAIACILMETIFYYLWIKKVSER
ncbi:MAG: hypothetical protein ACLTBX_04685 [Clostridia bacterium]